jgi:oligopeptide/dipeptide ABC transporter ATP-binding protein
MYAGQVVERAPVVDLFDRPRHPYTAGLFRSLPLVDGSDRPLEPIPGNVPDALSFPDGCRFHPRCERAFEACRTRCPELVERQRDHASACWFVDEHPSVDLRDARSDAEVAS